MSDDPGRSLEKQDTTERFFAVFLRAGAVMCLYLGLRYWALLIGYGGEGGTRFDLMSPHWRMAAVYLAAFYPVAAVGLWAKASWGPVVWIAAAGLEVLMHTLWPHLFGKNLLLVTTHTVVAAVYLVFKLVFYLKKRRAPKA